MTREELIRREYLARIERVVDHIYAHYGEELSIDSLADVAAFSRFHFHRVFSSIVGETVSDFVKRIRLQKAASRLADSPGETVTEVAMACGFSSPSVFARAFKERYGVTASEWRSLDGSGRCSLGWSKDDQAGGKARAGFGTQGQDASAKVAHPPPIANEARRKDMTKLKYSVEVKDLPELTVAYARHIGPYHLIGEAFERLGRWAGPRGFYAAPGAKSLAVYHDSPEATEESKLRSSACVSVPPGTEASGDINLMTVPGGKFAVAHFEIGQDEFGEAWDALMGEWFPSSGWQPDDRMCYELYLNDPEQHPDGKYIVDICEPVKPL